MNIDIKNMISFYKHTGKYGCLSNFYKTKQPYEFILPECVQNKDVPNIVLCENSEKAIMLCKASLMNDIDMFDEIIKSDDPKIIKALGRKVKNFNDKLWDDNIEKIAYDVVYQKFKKNDDIQQILLSTKNAILAEASPWDCIWGIGMDINDPEINDISKWRGKNLLGYALMKARNTLLQEIKT
jgi:ribA/ribD-fused uncharacterized protein|tara:strand:+ start:931 stop:1479 length:549 start_codon:yes stop_codon:yes gene_type:complete